MSKNGDSSETENTNNGAPDDKSELFFLNYGSAYERTSLVIIADGSGSSNLSIPYSRQKE